MDAQLRIIDANANRAREGIRTLEEIARFGLCDADLAERCKVARHSIGEAVCQIAPSRAARLDARDTPGDVGTAITTPSEGRRIGLADIASAGAARAAEAVRMLEECAKAYGKSQAASMLEAVRYAVYELEKRIAGRLLAAAPQWRVCVLLTTELCTHLTAEEVCERAIAGGADCVQVREKAMDSGPLLGLVRRIVKICQGRASVIVNDRADIAALAGADGVHVGQSDLGVSEARRIAGIGAIVGVSTSNIDQARRAVADGASYCGLGPMYSSTTKAKPELAGIDYLRTYVGDAEVRATPHLAISGITPANVGELAAAGCRGVAVSSVVCGAGDPGGVCAALRGALEAASGD